MNIMRIGLDLAKNAFEVFGVNAQEKVVQHKTLKRKEVLTYFCQLEP